MLNVISSFYSVRGAGCFVSVVICTRIFAGNGGFLNRLRSELVCGVFLFVMWACRAVISGALVCNVSCALWCAGRLPRYTRDLMIMAACPSFMFLANVAVYRVFVSFY